MTDRRFIAVASALAMIVAACGTASESRTATESVQSPPPASQPAQEQLSDDRGPEPWVPPGGIEDISSFDSASLFVDLGPSPLVEVTGVLFADERGWFVCNAVQEKLPPGCSVAIDLNVPDGVDPTAVTSIAEYPDPDGDVVLVGGLVSAVGRFADRGTLDLEILRVVEEPEIGRPGLVAGVASVALGPRDLVPLGEDLIRVAASLRREEIDDPLAGVWTAVPLSGALYVLVTFADAETIDALERAVPGVPLAVASLAVPVQR